MIDPNDFFSEEEKQQQQQPQSPTGQQVSSPMEAAQTAQPVEKPEGIITQIGEGLQDLVQGVADEIMRDPGGIMRKQRDAAILQAQQGGGTPGQVEMAKYLPRIDAISEPLTELPLFPLTAAARISGQDASWDNRPATIVDDDILADTIFDVTKVLAPTIVAGAAMGPNVAVPTALSVESGIETITQDSAEDMVAGRWLAGKFGEIYDSIGGDGESLSRDLVEGRTPQAQAVLAVWGFAQNYGINWGFDKLIKQFPKVKNIFTQGSEDIAKSTGKSVDEVEKSLTTFVEPPKVPDVEPADLANVDTIVPVPKAPEGQVINQEALYRRALADANNLPPVANEANGFFTNWSAVASTDDAVEMLKKVTKDLPSFELGGQARNRMIINTARWLGSNAQLLGDSPRKFLEEYISKYGILLDDGAKISRQTLSKIKDLETFVKDNVAFPVDRELGIEGVLTARYMAEDLGQRLVRASAVLDEMLTNEADITQFMENTYLPLERYTQAVLLPFRRAKRQFYLLGEAQQRTTAIEMQDLLGGGPIAEGIDETFSANATADEIERLVIDGKATADTIATLWTSAKEGDKDAFDLLKKYVAAMRYGEADKVLTNSEVAKATIKDQLAKKTIQANERVFYNVITLGQFGTQINATVPTLFRQALEPLALMGSINPKVSKADRVYAMGQLWGGVRYLNKSIAGMFNALITNKPAGGASRYAAQHNSNLLKEVKELKQLGARRIDELVAENAPIWKVMSERMFNLYRVAAFHPALGLSTRGLMASDEAARITAGTQVAMGRTFKDRHLNQGIVNQSGKFDFEATLKSNLNKIFQGNPALARIKDPEVKRLADKISLQVPLNKEPELTGPLEKFFGSQYAAAQTSGIAKFFNPFMKVAYNSIEQDMESLMAISGTQSRVNRFGFMGYKKYKEIYESADETMKLQLESQFALAQYIGISAVGFFLAGGEITDKKIIFPGEYNGKRASITYDKFSPFAIPLTAISSVVNQYKYGQMQHNDYIGAVGNIMFGMASSAFQKAFLQGQQQMAKIVDYSQGAENWLTATAGMAFQTLTPGLFRELLALINPYETIQDERTSLTQRLASNFLSDVTGNAFNPPNYDIYAPQFEPKGPGRTAGYQKALNQHFAQLAGMFYPGQITSTRETDPVFRMMEKAKWATPKGFTRTIYNAELTVAQQSELRKYMQGNLMPALQKYEKKDFPKLWEKYQTALDANDPRLAGRILLRINNDITNIHNQVKLKAAVDAGFNDIPELKEAILDSKNFYKETSSTPSARRGLYATAAQQDTQLASQVREILDFNNA